MNAPRSPKNPYNPAKPYYECHRVGMELFEGASQRFSFEQVLQVSPAELFAIFEDPDSWPKWAYGLSHVEWTSPKPFGVGTTRTVTFHGGIEVYEEFIAWEDEKLMAFVLHGHSDEIWWTFGERYDVVDMGSGRCKLTWTVAYEPRGGFAKASPYIRPMMWASLKSFMVMLERYCRNR